MPVTVRDFSSFRLASAQFLRLTPRIGLGACVKHTAFWKFPSNNNEARCLKTGMLPVARRRCKERKIIDLFIKKVITTMCSHSRSIFRVS